MTPLEILVLFSTFITVGFLNWLADYAESQCPAQSKPDEQKETQKVPEEIPAQKPLTPRIPTAPSVPATPRQPEEAQQPRKKIKQDLPLIIEYGVGPMP